MSKRPHLTKDEKDAISVMFKEVGASELLRLIGQLIAHNHADVHKGDEIRSQLCEIAKDV
jgi:hypothetical protein